MGSSYNDQFLDQDGESHLDQIIEVSESNPRLAVDQIDVLIRRYPKSPQLLISKSIIVYTADVNTLVPLIHRAIDLDPGFYDSFRRLSNYMLCLCLVLNSESSIRVAFTAFAIKGVSAVRDDWFAPDWERKYEDALSIRLWGLQQLDIARYTDEELTGYLDEYELLKDASAPAKKTIIATTFQKVIAGRLFLGKELASRNHHDRIAYWPPLE